MKKLLLILLCMPLIGFGNDIIVREGLYNHSGELYDWVNRDLLIFYEKAVEKDYNEGSSCIFLGSRAFDLVSAMKKHRGIESFTKLAYSTEGRLYVEKPYPQELINEINEWNRNRIYFYKACHKEYDLGDILMRDFEYGLSFNYTRNNEFFRSKRTFTEASDEGSINIFFLRRCFSFLPIALYLLIIYFIYKKIKKRYLKRTIKLKN